MATLEELQRVCKHHHGRADDFEGMETPIQNHTLRCWDCLVSLEPIPADVVAEIRNMGRAVGQGLEGLVDGDEEMLAFLQDWRALLTLLPKP